MCGIAGIMGKNANQLFIKQLLQPISHRGEPGYRNEIFSFKNLSVGAHRLAIIDEEGGKQPRIDQRQEVVSVFNGEIYNHAKLKQQIISDIPFLSSCDSEVVLNSYLKWGDDFVNYLDGKYAIAIYDFRRKLLILARDNMGIKPLYYARYRNNWVFSSEIKSFAFIQNNISEIIELEPGCIWKNNINKKYFNIKKFSNQSICNKSISDYIPKFKKHLTEAVEKRILKKSSAIPCLLSGGVDSSIIVYLAKQLDSKVIAYTLAAPNMLSSDLQAAQTLCQQLKVQHVIVSPSVKEMQDFYLKSGVYMTESFESVLVRNAVSYHFVCRQIREDGFKYCLNGEGADELFGGYDFINEVPKVEQDDMIWHSLSIIHKTYLQMADRASMYATLEARVPYMDKALVAFCLSLPKEARINNGINKAILRKSFQDELPQSIVNRQKSGMNEGAGFGINNSKTSIYYEAVRVYYKENPKKYAEDIKICKKKSSEARINFTSVEEIYNFAQFYRLNYFKLKNSMQRLQLNTKLYKDII